MAKSKKLKEEVLKVEDTQEVIKETQAPINLVGEQIVIGSKLGTLTEGKEYKVPTYTALILINKGFAYLKK